MRILEISYRRSTQPEKYCSEEISMTAAVGDSENPREAINDLRTIVHEELGLSPQQELALPEPLKIADAPKPADSATKEKIVEAVKKVKKAPVKPPVIEEKKPEVKKPEVKKAPAKKAPAKKEVAKKEAAIILYKTGETADNYKTHRDVLLKVVGTVCSADLGPKWMSNGTLKEYLKTVSAGLVGEELGTEAKNDIGFTVLPSFKAKATDLIKEAIASLPEEK